jgi:hypothetical protein
MEKDLLFIQTLEQRVSKCLDSVLDKDTEMFKIVFAIKEFIVHLQRLKLKILHYTVLCTIIEVCTRDNGGTNNGKME